jgi:hypothetical protein
MHDGCGAETSMRAAGSTSVQTQPSLWECLRQVPHAPAVVCAVRGSSGWPGACGAQGDAAGCPPQRRPRGLEAVDLREARRAHTRLETPRL